MIRCPNNRHHYVTYCMSRDRALCETCDIWLEAACKCDPEGCSFAMENVVVADKPSVDGCAIH